MPDLRVAPRVSSELGASPTQSSASLHSRLTMRHERSILPVAVRRSSLRVFVDEEGNTSVGHRNLPGFRLPFPYEDGKGREIMLEMQRRYDIDKCDRLAGDVQTLPSGD